MIWKRSIFMFTFLVDIWTKKCKRKLKSTFRFNFVKSCEDLWRTRFYSDGAQILTCLIHFRKSVFSASCFLHASAPLHQEASKSPSLLLPAPTCPTYLAKSRLHPLPTCSSSSSSLDTLCTSCSNKPFLRWLRQGRVAGGWHPWGRSELCSSEV